MASRVPATYASAADLSDTSRSMLALAQMQWDELTEHEREALRGSAFSKSATPRVESGRSPAKARLISRGLTTPSGFLTALGLLVREAGTKMTAEWRPKHSRADAA